MISTLKRDDIQGVALMIYRHAADTARCAGRGGACSSRLPTSGREVSSVARRKEIACSIGAYTIALWYMVPSRSPSVYFAAGSLPEGAFLRDGSLAAARCVSLCLCGCCGRSKPLPYGECVVCWEEKAPPPTENAWFLAGARPSSTELCVIGRWVVLYTRCGRKFLCAKSIKICEVFFFFWRSVQK